MIVHDPQTTARVQWAAATDESDEAGRYVSRQWTRFRDLLRGTPLQFAVRKMFSCSENGNGSYTN